MLFILRMRTGALTKFYTLEGIKEHEKRVAEQTSLNETILHAIKNQDQSAGNWENVREGLLKWKAKIIREVISTKKMVVD